MGLFEKIDHVLMEKFVQKIANWIVKHTERTPYFWASLLCWLAIGGDIVESMGHRFLHGHGLTLFDGMVYIMILFLIVALDQFDKDAERARPKSYISPWRPYERFGFTRIMFVLFGMLFIFGAVTILLSEDLSAQGVMLEAVGELVFQICLLGSLLLGSSVFYPPTPKEEKMPAGTVTESS